MNAERLKKRREAVTPEPVAQPVAEPVAAPVVAPAPVQAAESEPVEEARELTPTELDPLAADLIESIPDRPKRPAKAEPVAAPDADQKPGEPFRERPARPGLLVAAGAAVVAALVGLVVVNRRPADGPAHAPDAHEAPAPVAAPAPTPAPFDPLARPGRVVVIGGRTHA